MGSMDDATYAGEAGFDPYAELVAEGSPELFCDACGYYPIEPVHGHFVCPACKMPTKCCEGMPVENYPGPESESGVRPASVRRTV